LKSASLAYYGIDNCLKQCKANVMFGRKYNVKIGGTSFMLPKVLNYELGFAPWSASLNHRSLSMVRSMVMYLLATAFAFSSYRSTGNDPRPQEP